MKSLEIIQHAPLFARYLIPASIFMLLIFLEGRAPFFGGRTRRLRHAARNAALFAINTVVITLPFTPLVSRIMEYIRRDGCGISSLLSPPAWVNAVMLIIAFDLWMYLWHRMNHRVDFLWRFHRVHHSDTLLDVSTALRFHGGELLISAVLRIGIFIILGMDLRILALYESAMLPVVYLHHSNVNLPDTLDRLLRMVIVTPGMHRVHHSDIRHENNMNFGSLFAWWDRIFRSYMIREDIAAVRFGLTTHRDEGSQTVAGMLATPFRNDG